MIVDCDRCEVRGGACKDCVITVLLGAPPEGVELDGIDRRALHTLAEAGLVPRLQLVDRREDHGVPQAGPGISASAHGCAERSASDGGRSRRQVS
ncbi:MAG: hypothetical protein ACRDRP_00650 [Pseudonocardiaceae bacterium]